MAWTSSIATRATTYDVLASDWNVLVNNLNFLAEIGYTEYSSTVSSSATTVGTAVQVVSLGALTYINAPVEIEFFCERFNPSATNTSFLILRDSTTVLGTLGDTSAGAASGPVYLKRRLTPSAASHTYNVALWVAAGTASANAGSGGVAGDATTRLPGFIRARYCPT